MTVTPTSAPSTLSEEITDHEGFQIARANATGLIPMAFVHGFVPWAIANASFKQQEHNTAATTEIVQIPGRGHAITIDSGWRELAQTALDFVRRFT